MCIVEIQDKDIISFSNFLSAKQGHKSKRTKTKTYFVEALESLLISFLDFSLEVFLQHISVYQKPKIGEKIIQQRKTAQKLSQNRKSHTKPSKRINFHIPIIKTPVDLIEWWQVEHTYIHTYILYLLKQVGCGNYKDLGRVVREPINVNSGLNVNWSITFSYWKMFFTSTFWCSLRLLQLKTEGQTI